MGLLIGVVGASGGLGVSTLTCALAGAGARDGRVSVAVDGRVGQGRLDVTACCEHVGGYRWGDLTELSGRTDGHRLVRRLPLSEGVRVLSAGRGVPERDVVGEVLEALREAVDLVIVDHGDAPPTGLLAGGGADHERVLLMVCGLTARRLADADGLVPTLTEGSTDGPNADGGGADPPVRPSVRVGVLSRGPRRTSEVGEQVALHLDRSFVTHIPDDPRVLLDEVRGRMPGSHPQGPAARAVDRALAWATTVSRAGQGPVPPLVLGRPGR
jgi:hypothetical protein